MLILWSGGSPMEICRFCLKEKPLQYSHAIPNGFYRQILRENNGRFIALPKGSGKVHLSSETGKAKLLCWDCEQLFNKEYDARFVEFLRKWDKKIIAEGFGVRVSFDHGRFARCLASIIWRASLSESIQYCDIVLHEDHILELYNIMMSDDRYALKHSSVRVKRLNDTTPPQDGGFEQGLFSDFIFNINAYNIKKTNKHSKFKHVAFDLCIQGFLIHFFMPRLQASLRHKPGYLRSGRTELHAPSVNFFKYPPLAEAMVTAVKKKQDGEISFGFKANT